MLLFVPEYKIENLFAKIKRLNRRAEKLNLPLITYRQTGQEKLQKEEVRYEGFSKSHTILTKEIEVIGGEPVLEGYNFLCAVEHTEEGNIVTSKPGSELDLTEFRSCASNCDHCGHKRNRHKTYFVKSIETDLTVQVGSTCIKDFLGGNGDPEAMLEIASDLFLYIQEAKDVDFEESGGRSKYVDLQDYLGCVIQEVKSSGFVSRKVASERCCAPTSDIAFNILFAREQEFSLKDENRELAAKYLERGRQILEDKVNRNDFENNLYVITKRDYLDPKHAGIAAYFVEWLDRMDREKLESQAVTNEWFGKDGERVEMVLKFNGFTTFNSDIYGLSFFIRLLDDDGRLFVWKTHSPNGIETSKVGEPLKVKATIKRHTEWKNRKQTELSRLKVIENSLI